MRPFRFFDSKNEYSNDDNFSLLRAETDYTQINPNLVEANNYSCKTEKVCRDLAHPENGRKAATRLERLA
jgi:hypothetical protein